jgi:hypothetical protein
MVCIGPWETGTGTVRTDRKLIDKNSSLSVCRPGCRALVSGELNSAARGREGKTGVSQAGGKQSAASVG